MEARLSARRRSAKLSSYKGMLPGLPVDLLAGVLSGPHCSFQAPVFKNNTGDEPKVGQFFIAISPGGFTPGGEYAYVERFELMPGVLAAEPGVRLPGARHHETRLRAETEGVEVPTELVDKLESFAASSQNLCFQRVDSGIVHPARISGWFLSLFKSET